jgi:hypothetical protein
MKLKLTLIALLLLCPALHAQEATGPVVDPKADEILKAVGALMQGAAQYSFRAEYTRDEVQASGQKLQSGGALKVVVRRPDRLYVDNDGDRFHRTFFYDGKALSILDVRQSLYGVLQAPPTIDEALDFAFAKFKVTPPLSDLLYTNPYGRARAGVRSGSYLGVHRVGGVACDHLAFVGADADFQVWVEQGARPVIRKVVITYKNSPSSPQFTAVLSDWDFTTRPADDVFKFVAPKDASKIEFLADAPAQPAAAKSK